jgi:endonuclease/exonuclease/phosphatase family metal-dependent hydrolase
MVRHVDSQLVVSPGAVVQYSCSDHEGIGECRELKVVQWNIERAYKLAEIIELLKRLEADVIVVQEIDVYCQRSGYRNSAKELCEQLKMNGIFVVEFLEIRSSRRSKSAQGGGWHGNGILSKFELTDIRVIPHGHSPVNWSKEGWKYREPRVGGRVAITAIISHQGIPIQVYSIHLEIFCGIFGRLCQFADILRDVRSQIATKDIQHFLVFGDLNTMAHGLARMVGKYCRDEMRWRSIGKSEAQFWNHNLFDVLEGPNPNLTKFSPTRLGREDLEALWNPLLFDAHPQITTLQYYKGIAFRGKLDWTLMRGFEVKRLGTANDNYAFSDHKLLWVCVSPLLGTDCAQRAYSIHRDYIAYCKKARRERAMLPSWILFASVFTLLLYVVVCRLVERLYKK